jgi:glycosyltransferase involved in cell wall biosynthesis
VETPEIQIPVHDTIYLRLSVCRVCSSKGAALGVSVVIPAYNAEPYLEECLRSVLTQTHPVEEVLVIDDGSTDRTQIIAESFGSPVRLLQQQQGGPARARNYGVREARGEWIAFLDADDLFLPHKVEKQLRALAADPEAVLCYTGLVALKLDGSRVEVPPPALPQVDAMLSLTNVGIPPSAVMLRRDTLLQVGGFNEIQRGCEDWELWFRLRKLGSFCIVPDAETVYRESLGGLSSNAEKMYQDFLRMLDRVLLEDMHGWKRRVWRRRIMSYQQYKAAMTARHAGQPTVERKFLAASLQTWPSPLWHPERFAASLVHLRRSLSN